MKKEMDDMEASCTKKIEEEKLSSEQFVSKLKFDYGLKEQEIEDKNKKMHSFLDEVEGLNSVIAQLKNEANSREDHIAGLDTTLKSNV